MSTSIYTMEAQLAIKDPDTGVWGGYTDPKNLIALEIQKPEPTKIEDYSSRPDDTFASLRETFLVPKGQASIKLSTKDLVNRNSAPVEMLMLAAALSAKVASLTVAAVTAAPFSFVVTQLELNYPTGHRNLIGASTVVNRQASAAITGLKSGSVESATATVTTVTGAGWTASALIGKKAAITSGAGAGQVVAITANTATTFTVAAWTTPIDATSRFSIVESASLSAGSDYSVDEKYGTIKPLTAGSIEVGDVLTGTVTSRAISGIRFRGATVPAVTFRLQGKVKDIKNGNEGFMTVHEAVAYSSSAQQFVANAESPEFKTLELSGDLLVPEGFSEPYTLDDNLLYAAA
jgi:hypothetical protein